MAIDYLIEVLKLPKEEIMILRGYSSSKRSSFFNRHQLFRETPQNLLNALYLNKALKKIRRF
jgi:ERCC4-related helicase